MLSGYTEQRAATTGHLAQLEQSLAPLAAEAKSSVAAVVQALTGAEAAVGRLLSAVRGAGPFSPQERDLVAAQGGQLAGDLVSVGSRLRSLRDALDALRG